MDFGSMPIIRLKYVYTAPEMNSSVYVEGMSADRSEVATELLQKARKKLGPCSGVWGSGAARELTCLDVDSQNPCLSCQIDRHLKETK